MRATEAELTPDQRRRELAAILAAGILRLRTRPGSLPEPAMSGPDGAAKKSSDSGQKSLAVPGPPSPHGPAG